MALKYEVVEAKGFPGQWNVEAIDCDRDGQIYVAMFTGPDSHRRAVEYGNWMNSGAQDNT
jgi:hypothetical protein